MYTAVVMIEKEICDERTFNCKSIQGESFTLIVKV